MLRWTAVQLILLTIHVLLFPVRFMMWMASFALPRPPPPRRRVAEESPSLDPLHSLPDPPPVPACLDGKTVGFSACANLSFYCLGALACLQAAQKKVGGQPRRLQFSGTSSGAVVACLAALDVSAADWLEDALGAMEKLRWAVGIPTSNKFRFCPTQFVPLLERGVLASNPTAYKKACGSCGISACAFTPWPALATFWEYSSNLDLLVKLRGASGGPLVWPQAFTWVWPQGVLLDGALVPGFTFVACDVRVSPYVSEKADVGPAEDYPSISRVVLHRDDAVKLFADGFRDCAQWLRSL